MKNHGRIALRDTGINTVIDTGVNDFEMVKSLMRVFCARGGGGRAKTL